MADWGGAGCLQHCTVDAKGGEQGAGAGLRGGRRGGTLGLVGRSCESARPGLARSAQRAVGATAMPKAVSRFKLGWQAAGPYNYTRGLPRPCVQWWVMQMAHTCHGHGLYFIVQTWHGSAMEARHVP